MLVLGDSGSAMMLRDLAKAARMPASKAHRYLVSYLRMGLVYQEPDSGRYDLGPLALHLGLTALSRIDAVSLALPGLKTLSHSTNQTVALAVWANRGATIVRWVGTDAPVTASLRVGSVMPLTRSATGLVFLAHESKQRWSALVRQELADNRRRGLKPEDIAHLERQISDIRRAGYAAISDFIPGITGLAAPAFAHDGSIALAVISLGHSASFQPALDGIRAALLRYSSQLSSQLGYDAVAKTESR